MSFEPQLGHWAAWAVLCAAVWRRPDAAGTAVVAAFWPALEWWTGDARLLFPFAMGASGAAGWRWGWKGAAAGGAAFLLARATAGAPAAVLQTEAVGTALSLAAGLAGRRAGAAGAVAAASLAGLIALLL